MADQKFIWGSHFLQWEWDLFAVWPQWNGWQPNQTLVNLVPTKIVVSFYLVVTFVNCWFGGNPKLHWDGSRDCISLWFRIGWVGRWDTPYSHLGSNPLISLFIQIFFRLRQIYFHTFLKWKHPKGSHPPPNRMFFYTFCKRPLTPLPPPSVLHNHVADFSTRLLKSA